MNILYFVHTRKHFVKHDVPVVIIADLMAAGLQVGWYVLRRPAMPATWGQAIEVPCSTLKRVLRVSDGRLEGPAACEKAAIIPTPGPVMSGWNKLLSKWKTMHLAMLV